MGRCCAASWNCGVGGGVHVTTRTHCTPLRPCAAAAAVPLLAAGMRVACEPLSPSLAPLSCRMQLLLHGRRGLGRRVCCVAGRPRRLAAPPHGARAGADAAGRSAGGWAGGRWFRVHERYSWVAGEGKAAWPRTLTALRSMQCVPTCRQASKRGSTRLCRPVQAAERAPGTPRLTRAHAVRPPLVPPPPCPGTPRAPQLRRIPTAATWGCSCCPACL